MLCQEIKNKRAVALFFLRYIFLVYERLRLSNNNLTLRSAVDAAVFT